MPAALLNLPSQTRHQSGRHLSQRYFTDKSEGHPDEARCNSCLTAKKARIVQKYFLSSVDIFGRFFP
jgi:hypothetical protein